MAFLRDAPRLGLVVGVTAAMLGLAAVPAVLLLAVVVRLPDTARW